MPAIKTGFSVRHNGADDSFYLSSAPAFCAASLSFPTGRRFVETNERGISMNPWRLPPNTASSREVTLSLAMRLVT